VKPGDYRESRIVTEDTHYQVEDLEGTHSDSGTLHVMRVVWVRKSPEGQRPDQCISVYAEGVGLVTLEARFLGRLHSSEKTILRAKGCIC